MTRVQDVWFVEIQSKGLGTVQKFVGRSKGLPAGTVSAFCFEESVMEYAPECKTRAVGCDVPNMTFY